MRLFIALDIDSEIRRRITTFRDELRPLAPDVKWVNPETFHITLQFLGETKKLEEIQCALPGVKGAAVELSFRGAGFFPNSRAPRILWVGIEAGEQLQSLSQSIGDALAPFGFI